jgi:hypothetical protein
MKKKSAAGISIFSFWKKALKAEMGISLIILSKGTGPIQYFYCSVYNYCGILGLFLTYYYLIQILPSLY